MLDKNTFINSQVACALIEAQAMTAANTLAAFKGESPVFWSEDFMGLIDKYRIGHNDVISYLSD